MLEGRESPPCGIDDDTIELHTMGKLRDEAVREHIQTCKVCTGRVAEHASWIAGLKQALREHQNTESPSGKQETEIAEPPSSDEP